MTTTREIIFEVDERKVIFSVALQAVGSGEINTVTNIGTGEGLFKDKTGAVLNFKSLLEGDNISLVDNGDDITISASGDVVGPSSSTDNTVARYDETTGKLLQDSLVGIDDSGNITTPGTIDGRDISTDGSTLDSHIASASNPHSVTQAQVGLGNVDNTSDLDKPVSTAQQAALDANSIADRARANHTGTQTVATISDFDAEVSNNADVAANTVHRASTGADHSYINQDVQTTASPTFNSLTISNNIIVSGTVDGRDVALDGNNQDTHIADLTNPHAVTKAQVGLGNADNTSDFAKPISTATQTALDGKENNLPLSTRGDVLVRDASNNTARLGIGTLNQVLSSNGTDVLWQDTPLPVGTVTVSGTPVVLDYARFVDADTIEGRSYAEVKSDLSLQNVNNTSDLNKPVSTLQQAALDANSLNDTNRANHTGVQSASTINNFDTEVSNNLDVTNNTTHRGLTNNPHSVTANQILPLSTRGDILYRNEFNVTARLPVGTLNQVLLSDGDDVFWGAVPPIPGYVNTSGTPVINDFAKFIDADTVQGRSYAETKQDLSLDLVNNTSDLNKPISTATQSALDLKEDNLPLSTRGDILIRDVSNSTARLGIGTVNQVLVSDGTDISWGAVPPIPGYVNTSGVPVINDFARFTDADTIEGLSYAETKAALSLDQVDNTSDADKPISTATQTALDTKVDTSGIPIALDYARFTDADTVEGRSYTEVKTDLSLDQVDNTSDINKPISTATQNALDTKVDTSGVPVVNDFARFTDADTIEGLSYTETKTALSLDQVDNTSDVNKPISTATQTALDLKEDSLPLSTRGDILIRDASNTTARLGIGTLNQVLLSDGLDIAWGDMPWELVTGGIRYADGVVNVNRSGSNPAILSIHGLAETGLELQLISDAIEAQLVFDGSAGNFNIYKDIAATSKVYGIDGTTGTVEFDTPVLFNNTATFNNNATNVDFIINKNVAGEAYRYDAGLDHHWFNALAIFNQANADVDFIVRKNTSGTALYYNAGTDLLTISSDIELYDDATVEDEALRSIGFLWDTTEVAEVLATAGPDIISKNDGNLLFRTASGGTLNTHLSIDYQGTVIFNASMLDSDFIINKLTTGEAYRYDAGDDLHTYNSDVQMVNLGIGVAPSYPLHLYNAGTVGIVSYFENTGNYGSEINLDSNRSLDNDSLGQFNFVWDGTTVGRINGTAGEDTTNKDDGNLVFSTAQGGVLTDVLTIHQDTLVETSNNLKVNGQVHSPVHILTDQVIITPNWNDGNIQKVTITADRTIGHNSTYVADGAMYHLMVTQDATGGWELTWATGYKWPKGIPPDIDTNAGRTTIYKFISYNGELYGWYYNTNKDGFLP